MSPRFPSRDPSPSDEELVARIVAERPGRRAEEAARELFGRHQRRIYQWCLRYVRDHERALDLAQECQLTAWRRLDSFGGRARFTSWLFVLVRNRCLSELRRGSLLTDPEAELEEMADPVRNAEEELLSAEGERRLLELLESVLDDTEREALSLRCFEKLSVDEITRILDLDNRTGARGLLQRARRKLRAALAVEDAEASADPPGGEEP